MKLLVVEDNEKVASLVERGLREEGYAADVAHDGMDGIFKARVYDYDLLILDIMLPGKNGYEIVRDLRAEERSVPVLMLTARDATEDVVQGLDAGADDYLTKPFSLDELMARVRALVRRGGAERTERLLYADLEMDRIEHTASRAGAPLNLTPKGFQLLEYFLLHPEEVVKRTRLLEKVWDLQFDPMSNVVDVHVANLREKLREGDDHRALIHTIRGVGYMMSEEPPDDAAL